MMLSFGGGYVLKESVVPIKPQCSPFGIRKAEQHGISRNFYKFPTTTFQSQVEADHQLPRIKRTMGDVSTDSMCAVVTGANKGIGHEIVRRLALEGVTVVLTARDEQRGSDAVSSLAKSGLENVVFHQLDVRDQSSADSLAKYVQTQFGKLDILVNNAGASGVVVDEEGLRALNIDPVSWVEQILECLEFHLQSCKNLSCWTADSQGCLQVVSITDIKKVTLEYNNFPTPPFRFFHPYLTMNSYQIYKSCPNIRTSSISNSAMAIISDF
ncbi:hypothetical protein MKW92_026623 [Papaver armeniacum]|nr:hypothetical protein MKW92_026623 [Papaver armeniacum]